MTDVTFAISFKVEHCCECRMPFAMTKAFQDARLSDRGSWFYCPAGHRQWYVGESTEAKAIRERDIAKQQIARAEQEAREATRRAEAAEAEASEQRAVAAKARLATRNIRKRAINGVCPCCTRTFSNVAEHMRKQHPNVVAIKKVAPVRSAKA
jgi:rubrerythrin